MKLLSSILNAILSLLNRLSILKYRDDGTIIPRAGAIGLLIIVFVLCWLMASKVGKEFVFIVDDVQLSRSESLSIGENSDICFKGVPHDYLTINRSGDTFSWNVNSNYRDTLQYYKINDVNPNMHLIRDDDSQVLSLRLPTSHEDVLNMQLTGADIWKTWKKFRKQKDVMVRHFATFQYLQSDSVNETEKSLYMDQMQQHAVRSFLEHDDGTIKLVILDEFTQITENGQTISYVRSGTASNNNGRGGKCKVQFFNIDDYCYMEDSPERGYFHIDGVNYVMKASVKLTEWGAGHAMITPTDNGLRINFPRPITLVSSVDSLKKKSELSSKIITLKQDNNSFPTKSDLYLPAFSNAINFDLCNIELFHGKDSIMLRDNNNVVHPITNSRSWFLPFSIIPSFNKATLHSGNEIIDCRIGFINKGFIMSYLWLPLFTCLVLILLVWLPISVVRLSNFQLQNMYNKQLLRHYPLYLTLLLLTCLVYCTCKSLIALKLSYSFPYFEKLTAIIPFSTAGMMLLFFSLAMVLNTILRHEAVRKKGRGKLFINWFVCLGLLAMLVFTFFFYADPHISQGVIDSYYNNEVFDFIPTRWLKKYGINDTHRSVVYALFFVTAVVLVIWLIFDIFWKGITLRFNEVSTWFGKKADKWNGDIAALWDRKTKFKKIEELSKRKSGNKIINYFWGCCSRIPVVVAIFIISLPLQYFVGGSWLLFWATIILMCLVFVLGFLSDALIGAVKTLCPWHLLLIIALIIIGNRSGNFGTAFITLLVVFGLSHALTSTSIEKDGKPRHVVFGQMIFISFAYIIGAMAGDNGYMTNYLGIAMCLVCFFFLMKRPIAYENKVRREALIEKRWVNTLLAVLAVTLIFMPKITSHIFSPENVDYGRFARRIMLYSNFEDLERSGYRYSESDAEFMVIMSHYMQNSEGHDPLSNDHHFLHSSVSTGQSPVVINDLSVPMAFFGTYGVIMSSTVFFLTLLLIIWIVLQLSMSYFDPNHPSLTRAMQWRLLAMFMYVGTSFYIYLSYIDRLPFTGRLVPGFGVDAVGEALETAILLAFMAAVTCKKSVPYFNRKKQ